MKAGVLHEQGADEGSFGYFRSRVLRLTGIDLNCYKGAQLTRRLQFFARRHRMEDYAVLIRRLEEDPGFLDEFRDFLTINVSEFFRNPEKFEELRVRILPELLAGNRSLRIWSAGCSHGAEIYSVAMILDRLDPQGHHQLLATDLDRAILEKARAAVYAPAEVRAVPPDLRERHFRVLGNEENNLRFDERLARRVEFRCHNLLQDPMPQGMDLILCRNVVIYFTEEAKDKLYRGFCQALRPGGFLFIGGTEAIFNYRDLGFRAVSPCFYRKEKDSSQPAGSK